MITSVECSEPGHALPVANMNPFSENQSNYLDKNTQHGASSDQEADHQEPEAEGCERTQTWVCEAHSYS